MYIPSENTANIAIATVSVFPGTVLAVSLTQTEIAVLAIMINVFLAVGLKGFDVAIRMFFDARAARKLVVAEAADAREAILIEARAAATALLLEARIVAKAIKEGSTE